MVTIKRVKLQVQGIRTGSPAREVTRWTLVDSNGRQIDGYFARQADAERALRLLPEADRNR